MIGLIQRVQNAKVVVQEQVIGQIGRGMLVLVGVEKNDDQAQATRLLERLLSYRIFADNQDKMNLSLRDTQGGLLLVPQFTLAADTRKGARPSFSSAACPQQASDLFAYLLSIAQTTYAPVASGQFGADMQPKAMPY